MRKRDLYFIAALLWCVAGVAQEPGAIKVPVTDPSRPVNLKVTMVTGSVTVRGYDGKEVVVQPGTEARPTPSPSPESARGMRRIDLGGGGPRVTEQDNTVQVSVSPSQATSLVIQVPRATSANLKLVNGSITVDNVEGEIEANTTSGGLTLSNISGSVIGHSLNGKIVATFDQVAADKPMSFTSLNGDIDVTLPADVRARFKMKTDRGDVYTDFDMKLESGQAEQPAPSAEGLHRIRMDHTVYGTVNGGGPDYQFTTMSGTIRIRKK